MEGHSPRNLFILSLNGNTSSLFSYKVTQLCQCISHTEWCAVLFFLSKNSDVYLSLILLFFNNGCIPHKNPLLWEGKCKSKRVTNCEPTFDSSGISVDQMNVCLCVQETEQQRWRDQESKRKTGT